MTTSFEGSTEYFPSTETYRSPELKAEDDRWTEALIGQHQSVMQQVVPGSYPAHQHRSAPNLLQRILGVNIS